MSKQYHTLVCGQQRRRGWAKEEPYLYYFPFTPELLGAPVFGHFPHRKHPSSPRAAQPRSCEEVSCSHAIDRGVRQRHREHFNDPPLSIRAFLLTRLKWEPSFHLRGMSRSDPALIQFSGSSRDWQRAILLLEGGTREPPAPVRRQRQRVSTDRGLFPQPRSLLGSRLPRLISRTKKKISRGKRGKGKQALGLKGQKAVNKRARTPTTLSPCAEAQEGWWWGAGHGTQGRDACGVKGRDLRHLHLLNVQDRGDQQHLQKVPSRRITGSPSDALAFNRI